MAPPNERRLQVKPTNDPNVGCNEKDFSIFEEETDNRPTKV